MGPHQALYLGLALAFRPPTWGHVEGGADNALLGLVAEVAVALGCTVLQEPLTGLRDYLDTLAQRHAAEALVELAAEYNRLFVGPLPALAHPYESVYRTPGGLVMGDCTLEVLQAYAEAGLVLSATHKDLPDHIAVELEYIALLWQQHEEASTAALEAVAEALCQKAGIFLTAHLCRWLPQFCQRVLQGASLPYYGQWAEMAARFTQWDAQRLRPATQEA